MNAANGITVISIDGMITSGDFSKFEAIRHTGRGVVVLTSPGGAALDALAIGEVIHQRGYATYVHAGAHCESACALMWLAGTAPTMSAKALIGFHAAHVNGAPSTQGNALVGAYLHALNVPVPAIIAFTEAAPLSMRYFSASELASLGVRVQVKEVDGPSQQEKIEAAAVSFVQSYAAAFSSGEGLSRFYSEKVLYYKNLKSRQDVISDFAYLARRWPMRRYWVQRITLLNCTEQRCMVGAMWAWDNSSPARNERSVGEADLSLVLRVTENGFAIETIDGNVTTRRVSPLVQRVRRHAPGQECLFGVFCVR